MKKLRFAALLTLATGAALILAACGGDDDNSNESETGIRTDRGLAVAAIGAAFDPRFQGEADQESTDARGAEPAPAVPGRGIAMDDVRLRPDYAPALQEGGTGITVQGYGTASADADSAIVEFYFFAGGGGGVEPQPAPDTGTSSSNGSAGAAEPAPPVADADVAVQEVAPITEETLQPVIDALVSAGVPREDIEFIGQGYFDKFSSSATLRVTISNLGILDAAVTAATNAAANLASAQLSSTNVSYTVSDCGALEQAAMQEAVTDAGERGAAFAETLGVGLGAVVGASHYSYSPYGGNACSGSVGGPIPLAEQAFVQGGSQTVQVFANISVTYAIQ
jgi:uncharacterized protein YggE